MSAIKSVRLVVLSLPVATGSTVAAPPPVALSHLCGNGYVVVEVKALGDENSSFYIGTDPVTIVGATFTPESARLDAHSRGAFTFDGGRITESYQWCAATYGLPPRFCRKGG